MPAGQRLPTGCRFYSPCRCVGVVTGKVLRWGLLTRVAGLPYRVESATSAPILDLLTAAGISLFVADITPPLIAHELTTVRAVSADLYPLVVGEEAGPFELIRSTERIKSPHPF